MADVSYACGWIGDGLDESAYIAGERRLYPPVHFTYRPLLITDRNSLSTENATLKSEDATRHTAEVLAGRISKWDLRDRKGNAVPVTADNILGLRPALYERLAAIVLGFQAGDDDPTAKPSPAEKREAIAEKVQATRQGVSIGEAKEERREGN